MEMNARQATAIGRARAREALAAQVAAMLDEPDEPVKARRTRRSTRATGTNPRARGMSPRQLAQNPTAGLASDVARAARMKRQALARHYVSTGERWCLHCDDTGWIHAVDSAHVEPCADHRAMTTNEAYWILHPDE